MSFYVPPTRYRRRRGRGAWAVLGVSMILAMGLLVLWVQGSGPTLYVTDSDGVWRPRVSDQALPEGAGTGSTRILDEQIAGEGGAVQFIRMQEDGQRPVTFDPCAKIKVEVNYDTAPENGRELTENAIAEVQELTALKFEIIGETDRDVSFGRDLHLGQPVRISWTDSRRQPSLEGDVLGMAGAVPVSMGVSGTWFLTGQVALDGPDLRRMPDKRVSAVIKHELAHLVGLDHVDDRNELMYPTLGRRTEFGVGDRRGLAELGSGGCMTTRTYSD
ncbi:MAG: matrixin family metalloprotease [Aeromicrobium sp.]|nr:MAG: matrixin family metalloprotease [Aeromicrobium sp.]